MSDENRPSKPGQHDEAGDEVEAHHGHRPGASVESDDEVGGDDEVEAHHHGARPGDKVADKPA